MKSLRKVIWILQKAIHFCFPYIFVNILVLTFTSATSLAINFVNKSIINELSVNIGKNHLTGLFIGLVIAYMCIYFINMANGFLGAFGMNFFRLNVDKLFHKIFMFKSSSNPQENFFKSEFLEKYEFVCRNTSKISAYIGSLSGLIFTNIGVIVGSFALFAIYKPLLIFYSLIIVLVATFTTRYISKKEFDLDKKQIKEQRFHNYYKKILTGKEFTKELRLYKSKLFFFERWSRYFSTLKKERLELDLKKAKLQNISAIIKFFSRAFAIGVLIFSVYSRKYDIGTFILLLGLIDTCNEQINNLISSVVSGVYKDIKYLEDYYDFVTPITNEDIREILAGDIPEGGLPFGNFRSLKLHGVSYTYPNSSEKALDNVSLTIKKGEIISIIGYNGSGKTTLSKIMSGCILAQTGSVLINDQEIHAANQRDVFKYFGFGPQEFPKISLSIKEIVGLGRVEVMSDQNQLDAAYDKVNLQDLLQHYTMGQETIVGKEYDDNGIDLSGGEWQKLIISSAYMGNPEILLLDEPTASIDPLKEMEMIKNIRINLRGKTAVLISHRIGFARIADRIVLMEKGKISEEGTHDELLIRNGLYAKMFNNQKKLYEEEMTV